MAEFVTKTDLAATRDHLEQSIHQTLRLTIRLAGIMAANIAVMVAAPALSRLL